MQNQQIRQNLVPQSSNFDPIQTVTVTDKIFLKAYLYFKLWNIMNMIYSSLKVFAAVYFIVIQPATHLTIYMLVLQISSIVQLSICTYMHRVSKIKEVYYLLAEKLEHLKVWSRNELSEQILQSKYRCVEVYDFTNEGSEQDDKRMKDLATQIKYYMHYVNPFIMHLGHFNFGIYQLVHFWGVLLLFVADFKDENQENFVIVVIFVGTFQYMEFYVMIIFCLVIMPFWLIKNIQNYLVHKYNSYKMEQLLKSQTFDEHLIKGDQDCKICLQTYQQNDSIIVLKCSQLHNFHAACFREWAKTSSTCPLCRRNIIDF